MRQAILDGLIIEGPDPLNSRGRLHLGIFAIALYRDTCAPAQTSRIVDRRLSWLDYLTVPGRLIDVGIDDLRGAADGFWMDIRKGRVFPIMRQFQQKSVRPIRV